MNTSEDSEQVRVEALEKCTKEYMKRKKNSKEDVAAIFAGIEGVLAQFPEVGAFDQTL